MEDIYITEFEGQEVEKKQFKFFFLTDRWLS